MSSTNDMIEKVIEIPATVSRVWRALTDHQEFGQWFQVKLDGPFKPGEISTGKMTYPGHEGLPWRAIVDELIPETLFAFHWHDYDEHSELAISDQPTTRVEFRLEAVNGGSKLTIREFGFSNLSDPRRLEVMRDNTEGWNIQAENLRHYVANSD